MSNSPMNPGPDSELSTESLSNIKEAEGGGGGSSSQSGGRRCCTRSLTFLNLCRVLRFLAFLSLATIAGVMLSALIEASQNETDHSLETVTSIASLFFHMCTSLILITAMYEADCLFRHIRILQNWLILGLCLVYLSCLTLATVSSSAGSFFTETTGNAIRIASYILFFIGCLFGLLGCIGGKNMKKRREELERRRQQLRDDQAAAMQEP